MFKYAPDDMDFYIEEWKWTKTQRTKAQNATFYRCFTEIWKKMWYDKETVKQNTLKWCFWVEKVKFWWVYYENALKPRTSELNKEEARFLIDALIEFWKKLWLWNLVTPRELRDLFE